ncbi:hypothetical protein TraAM80_01824 [Trypanosoma rangeli]|uniref:Chromatin assembly factor 1 subunit A dimerization domain-containing protein n=1 Tax=Trypanosoma rangeli TaxID=5698 RepID=A0A422NX43_TRYRA|nr:uncharacterized protein TraAM80_01824 [Trypanosoma rangeli]RNF09985.1 hypothetical protein TraAM80_01824 [Trypanosoma rangeli]|eukprot:RNF09985.1 hypothetical protein TraAM80_01824 [Trypanosoma rangeli]
MDQLESILSGLAPGHIERAVQLLQRYTAAPGAIRGEVTGDAEPSSVGLKDGDGVEVGGGCDALAGGAEAVSSVIAIALQQAIRVGPASTAANAASTDYEDDDDIPFAALVQKRQQQAHEARARAAEEHEEEHPTSRGGRTLARKGNSLAKGVGSLSSQQKQHQAPAIAARSLASFGFVTSARKPAATAGDKKKLITPFVQDRRVVPVALRFWCHDEDAPAMQAEPLVPALQPHAAAVAEEPWSIAVNEETSSLLHSPVMFCGDKEEAEQQQHEGPARRYASFTAMVDATTTTCVGKGSEREPRLQCPCTYHVRLAAPRTGFRNEVVFCGFYAIGYDPCQARPPYFGTYNSQDALNTEELLQLARFDTGKEMIRISNLDYEYDSGDDWDVVEGDEDLEASSSDTDDEEDDDEAESDSDSGGDFINDNNDEDGDSDAELQRKMVEERQRRLNRLRHKDKLVPAFSGPFVGVPWLEHPLRAYDRLERLGSALDGAAFTALMEQEMRGLGSVMASSSPRAANGGGSGAEATDADADADAGGTVDHMEERMLQQRLVAAALRNRREMLPEELDAVHAIVAANGKVSPKAIVEALQEQHLCVGVARAEILRTIRRYYERKHNTMVRRTEPWSPTDERLFTKHRGGGGNSNNRNDPTQKESNSNNNSNGALERGRGEDEEEEDCEGDEDVPLMELARKRPREEADKIVVEAE